MIPCPMISQVLRDLDTESGSPHDPSGIRVWHPLDYQGMDERNECERRKWKWEAGPGSSHRLGAYSLFIFYWEFAPFWGA